MNSLELIQMRALLQFKAVQLRTLDIHKKTHKVASGFIRRESTGLFLYTCWHVVTGYTRYPLQFRDPPVPKYLEVSLQDVEERNANVTAIGSKQTFELPLYESEELGSRPLWLQDGQSEEQHDLAAIGLRVPFWHDAVKLRLPDSVRTSRVQVNQESDYCSVAPFIGDKVYIVGYPYGFSAAGLQKPVPVVLTRFIAATAMEGRQLEILLDASGTAGMSGGPIYFASGEGPILAGIYTGAVFPDRIMGQRDYLPPLGTFCPLNLCFGSQQLALVGY